MSLAHLLHINLKVSLICVSLNKPTETRTATLALSLTTLVVRAIAILIHLMQHRGKALCLIVEFFIHVAFSQFR